MGTSEEVPTKLAVDVELRAAVFLPAGFVFFGAELTLFAVADYSDARSGDASADQCGAGGVGAVFAEGDVVLGRATIIAVAADEYLDGGMRGEVASGGDRGCLSVGAEVEAVVVEEDVPDVFLELGVGAHVARFGRVVCGGGQHRYTDGDADVRFDHPAVTLGDEMEVGGIGGRDGLRAVDWNRADAVDDDAGGVGGAPVEDKGLADVDGERIGGEGGGGRGLIAGMGRCRRRCLW